jgi:hypothetical protein
MLPRGKYRHYKGNTYTVVAIAKHSETLEDMVVYQDDADSTKIWVRPLVMFQESVEINGEKIPRFTPIQ